jgi:Cu-processing system ATP-binding protein
MISFTGFTKAYGDRVAVEALTIEVGAGEIVALLGPNGSGKTTTLKAAAGLVRPTAGEVRIGTPPRPALDPESRRQLSYLPQRVSFPDALTGREVVEFYRALRNAPPARTDDVLRLAALNGASDRAVSTYSGGMTQRLGLAVAMVPDADILLLDEPTAALDADGLAAFYDLVEGRRAGGRTVFFTSHYIGDAERLADRCIILVEGRLAASLTRGELRARLSSRDIREGRLDLLYRELTAKGGVRCA